MVGPRGSTGIGERAALFREARNRSARFASLLSHDPEFLERELRVA
jgi:hypothetical protein